MVKKALSKEEILHLADLAKLSLTESEIDKYTKQLGETIDFIKNLDELDTKDVLPTNSVVDLKNINFDDGGKNEKSLNEKEALQNAPNIKDKAFIVGRIM
ncbi:hypothetical protein A2334_02855 [Candidatus Roizmanbacteria bacterium RIFOXYB2_FULL_38_10]|uniref:Aspartyl/glutamyl-tRNA(Asn/Gln) amidotransferase subunit C n=1 Tax=Candidatus Roizmanbacteria bacterium RIFOXYD1_FULL_38_12 TaxID=1802093 RepID=A0A1F7L0F2_9BACT|nr:MAG: hypothetical protein A3K47_02145 [Candidatus Roizmanbacteria bacterium RIFOXYA2_FULL_38_14]OGK63578.1 MAG: hypothetical protein A3K27_02145 [Candidatus Roizmanbacteria bacterium RIFOXYA1_FULL_37_12]OGK65424.1 MAG: hypothetical protein A3K38_02145 [Candidatus Roizmanbacteria bacterium RIFOXYB1_FULL_40_23]OGK69099.1 MAG: hypothetical protein A2334_02855 [Candidatus Roizmanbacteria bacterium RIFOXYB2_FULL_38_10]OGK69829.1 MAG: hypothetical protein A3K21_02150 [Candidatus Roizmanbacteria ba